jgi:hypothetical protein
MSDVRPDNTQLVWMLGDRDLARVADSEDELSTWLQVDLGAADANRYGYRGLS